MSKKLLDITAGDRVLAPPPIIDRTPNNENIFKLGSLIAVYRSRVVRTYTTPAEYCAKRSSCPVTVLVVRIDELLNGFDELAHAAMYTAAKLLCRQRREPALDQVHPGSVHRCEVEMEAGMTFAPALDGGTLVGAGVVEDEMDLEPCGYAGVDLLEEPAELA
jgi:hypothetical protein